MKALLKRLYALSITIVTTITIMPILNINSFADGEWIKEDSTTWVIIENGVKYITHFNMTSRCIC